jgi:rhodanese-related sulfurtransferase
MRRLHSFLALGVTALLVALAACSDSDARPAEPVQPDQLSALLAGEDAPLLLDVRTPDEFAQGHVPGATLIPVQELEARLGELAAYERRGVVTYCEKGPRAAKAAELLRAHGFSNVRQLDGGIRRWRDEGRELETGP